MTSEPFVTHRTRGRSTAARDTPSIHSRCVLAIRAHEQYTRPPNHGTRACDSFKKGIGRLQREQERQEDPRGVVGIATLKLRIAPAWRGLTTLLREIKTVRSQKSSSCDRASFLHTCPAHPRQPSASASRFYSCAHSSSGLFIHQKGCEGTHGLHHPALSS